jgi:integrase
MPSAWITTRPTADGGKRYRVIYRVGGRESSPRYAGSFPTKRDALTRRAWVTGELAAMRVPNLGQLAEPAAAPTFAEVAKRWQASRVDVRPSTLVQHDVALKRVLPHLGGMSVDAITAPDVAAMIGKLHEDGKARESIRKSLSVTASVLDFAGSTPNPARDKVHVRLPREEANEMEPPTTDAVEAVAHLLAVPYMVATVALDATGCRVGELELATLADLDESRRAWLARSAITKTAQRRWITLPADVWDVLLERLPAREDRDPAAPLFAGVTADRLRTAIGRACRDAGVVHFSPHALRHRRISLWHRQGVDWATIGARVGQRDLTTTANTYTHALIDATEINWAGLLKRARVVQPPVHTPAL